MISPEMHAVRMDALKRKNRRLISALQQLRGEYRPHLHQLAELFNVDPETVEKRWDDGFEGLRKFCDCEVLLAQRKP